MKKTVILDTEKYIKDNLVNIVFFANSLGYEADYNNDSILIDVDTEELTKIIRAYMIARNEIKVK